MGRILAIDYGSKRTGIAVTDPEKMIATALTTVQTSGLMEFLKKYCSENYVEQIIIGEPKRMDGTETHSSDAVKILFRKIKENISVPVVMYDERFTSKIAMQSLISSGVKKSERRNKELVDRISATLILQSYLESINK